MLLFPSRCGGRQERAEMRAAHCRFSPSCTLPGDVHLGHPGHPAEAKGVSRLRLPPSACLGSPDV
eukprot:8345417-Lingulodinium_polyedra.AAC.1